MTRAIVFAVCLVVAVAVCIAAVVDVRRHTRLRVVPWVYVAAVVVVVTAAVIRLLLLLH